MQSQAGWKYPAQFCYLGVSYRTKHSRYNCKLNLFQLKMLFFDWFRVSGHLRTVFVTEAWNLFFLKKSMQSVCRNYCLSLALIFFLGGDLIPASSHLFLNLTKKDLMPKVNCDYLTLRITGLHGRQPAHIWKLPGLLPYNHVEAFLRSVTIKSMTGPIRRHQ